MTPMLGILASSGLKTTSSYESIATVTVGSGGQSSVTFSSIPSTYKHLQVRAMHLYTGSGANMVLSYNSGAFNNVISHYTYGNGSSVTSSADSSTAIISLQSGATTTDFCVAIYDILDYTNTSKNKTLRGLVGQDRNGSGAVAMISALATNTSAINALTFTYAGGPSFQQYTQFALYGIK